MICYHTTTLERLPSIIKHGLVPNSPPTWFKVSVPYVMLSKEPWLRLHSERMNIVLEVSDGTIKKDFFEDTEGLRWNRTIKPKYLRIFDSDYFDTPPKEEENDN